MIKPNISTLNAMMRITCGLTAVAWATSRLVRRPQRLGFMFVAMMGGMKVAEGFFRFCPVTAVLKSSGVSLNQEEQGSEGNVNKQDKEKSSS